MTYPSGKVVSYQYSNGRVAGVSVDGAAILNQIAYNAANQVTGWQWANGGVTWRNYDQDGRLVQQSLANLSRSLSYDAVGNILNINDGSNQYGYGYDQMNRLVTANNLSYGYDLNSNRLTGELNNYSYDPSSNKLLGVSGFVSRNYQYDATGNAVSDGLHSYSYNAENQLAEVVGVASYLYNGLGQRVAKNVGGVLSHYAYDENSRLIGEYNATGQVLNETVYLFGQPIAVLKGTDVFNVHTDYLGSPRKITNQAGTVVWVWGEKEFGDSPVNQDPDNDGVVFEYNLRFPGQFFDSETGLYYNYHRYYDSQTGRYITSDPIGLAGGWNTYGYVGGNSIRYIDSLGLDIMVITGGVRDGSFNIFGHIGVAVQDFGMASYGNDIDLGSSVEDYLSSQSLVRNQQVTIIPTTPAQDALARDFIKKHPNKNDVGKLDNCAVRTNEILNAAGVSTNDIPFPGGTARDVESIPGAKTYYIYQGGLIPLPLHNDFPKYNK